jgi:methyl-accepting chemotaxis protein
MPIFDRGRDVRERLGEISTILQSIEAKIGSDVQNLYKLKVDVLKAAQDHEGYLRKARDELERGISQLTQAMERLRLLAEGSKSFGEELARLRDVFDQVGRALGKMKELAGRLAERYEELSSHVNTLSTLIRPDIFSDLLNRANDVIQKAEELRLEQRTSFYQQKMQNLLEVVKKEAEKAVEAREEAEKALKKLKELKEAVENARREREALAEKVEGAKAELKALQRKIAELEERRRAVERSLREEAVRFTAELGEVRNKLDAYLDLLKLRYEELIDIYKRLDPEKAKELIQKAAEL